MTKTLPETPKFRNGSVNQIPIISDPWRKAPSASSSNPKYRSSPATALPAPSCSNRSSISPATRRRLRAVIQFMNNEFSENFQKTGHKYHIDMPVVFQGALPNDGPLGEEAVEDDNASPRKTPGYNPLQRDKRRRHGIYPAANVLLRYDHELLVTPHSERRRSPGVLFHYIDQTLLPPGPGES